MLYVWFDAPIGYISATRELTPDWKKYWMDEETKMVHFIGKDNIVFHCIVFPAMLKGHGGYILPENVPANEFLNLEGDKISTSRNWAVWLHEYLDEFPGKEDVLRYVLCANAPETKDNDFTWRDFQARNNNELVAVLGNFVNRALVLTQKYYGGAVPEPGELTAYDKEILGDLPRIREALEENLEHYRFRDALKEAMNIARLGNKYLADTEPWKLVKTDEERVKTIMYVALQITANLAIAIEPFMPFTAARILRLLDHEKFFWERLGHSDLVPTGHAIAEPELLFEKIEDAAIEAQLLKLEKTKKTNQAAQVTIEPQKAEIQFEDFERMDIRVSKVLETVDMPTILFFLGILMSVSALQSAGILTDFAGLLDANVHEVFTITGITGVLSAVVDNVPLVAACMGMYPVADAAALASSADPAYLSAFVQDGLFWHLLAYCAGVGGSILIIGSAAGVVAMGLERISFGWYFRRISLLALSGYGAGMAVIFLLELIF